MLFRSTDVLFAVAEISTLDEVLELPGTETTSGVGELEWPEEVGGLLEVGADGVDLVDEVLNGDDAELAENLLDDSVVGKTDTLLVDLAIPALVDELADVLVRWVSVCDVRLHDLQHLKGGLGCLDEDTIVDLKETEKLEGLALLGVDLVDTANKRYKRGSLSFQARISLPLDTDSEDQLGLSRNEE